jgi:hypothetical protein
MTQARRSVRELYRRSSDRISLAIELFGPHHPAQPAEEPTPENLLTVHTLVNKVTLDQSEEPESAYQQALIQVGQWLCGATTADFLTTHLNAQPHVHYVVRKGLEVMHMLLHRDLRRRVFSSSESQIYYNFVRLTAHLPNPSRKPIDPESVNRDPARSRRASGPP